jgi:hypothetical protein
LFFRKFIVKNFYKLSILEQCMTNVPDKDPTKTNIWFTIKKKTQEKLVTLFQEYNDSDTPIGRVGEAEREFVELIHKSLGIQSGSTGCFIKELEDMVYKAKGGLIDQMKEYIYKYKTVENAVKKISKKREDKIKISS